MRCQRATQSTHCVYQNGWPEPEWLGTIRSFFIDRQTPFMQAPDGKRILIVGASYAGFACALTLARAGHQVQLIDDAAELQARRVGVVVQAEFARAMNTLGLSEVLQAITSVHKGLRFCGLHGELLAELPAQSEVLGRTPALGLEEGVLLRVLHDAAVQAGAQVQWGRSVSKVDDTPHGVNVTMLDGEETSAHLMLIAQGVTAPLRSMVFGEQYRPRPTGIRVWRALVPRAPGAAWAHVYARQGMGRHMSIQWAHLESAHSGAAPAQLDTMLEALSPLGGVMGEALQAMQAPGVPLAVEWQDTFSMPPPWHQGHVLLVGDAAHCSVAQWGYGLGQSLEDALVLAELLAEPGAFAALSATLSAFARRRHHRTRLVADVAHQLSQWEIQTVGQFDFVRAITHVAGALAQPM